LTIEITKEDLEKAVGDSRSYAEVLRKLGFNNHEGRRKVRRLINESNLDISHFKGQSWAKGKKGLRRHTKETFVEEVLKVNGRGWNTDNMKLCILEFELLENKCAECGSGPEWSGKILVLQIDHINGERQDNRLENLRILCPNCHSQTSTYCGRKNRK